MRSLFETKEEVVDFIENLIEEMKEEFDEDSSPYFKAMQSDGDDFDYATDKFEDLQESYDESINFLNEVLEKISE